MSQIPGNIPLINPAPARPAQSPGDLRDVDLDQFMQLLITELQNQDPLNPMENSDILQQISQIREISATNQLTDTLDAVLGGQNLSMASSLIGRAIDALDTFNQQVRGVVDRVTMEVDDEGLRTVQLHVGTQSVPLNNIRQIVADLDALPALPPTAES